MKTNNSDWIMGAPKEVIACEWVKYGWSEPEKISWSECADRLWYGVSCYRHRPIKKEENK